MKKLVQTPRVLAFGLAFLSLTFVAQTVFAHGMSEAEKQAIVDGGNLAYLWLGATHMLTGYDHLAFVFGIIFFLTNFRDIAKYVTAFTVGHSITLIGATFAAVQVSPFLIEPIIALSVAYIAFHNLDGFQRYFDIKAPNMMFMIVGLGLIHGLGLSTRLQDLPLSTDSLLLNIISFNVGVELGQVSALAVMLVLVAAWRKRPSFAKFSRIANFALIGYGLLLFLMQMHAYEHNVNADEFTAAPVAPAVEKPAATTQWKDTITVTIPARGNREYKVLLKEGSELQYAWNTHGPKMYYDFHGEPTDGPKGYFESFEKATESTATGALTATFGGTHGWYWKNTTAAPITITLKVAGAYERMDLGK